WPPHGRLHRDAAAESVFRGLAQGDAGQARVGQWRACGDPAARLRRRRRSAAVHEGMRAADHRVLLPGMRRPRAAAPARQETDYGARDRASRREAVDGEGVEQCRPAASARHAVEPARGIGPPKGGHYVRPYVVHPYVVSTFRWTVTAL